MVSPPQVSRSFPLLTLLMAVPLVAILGYVAYTRYVADDAPGDGWKTYRNERFKYEIKYPPTWQVGRDEHGELQPGMETGFTDIWDRTVPTPGNLPRSASDLPIVYPARAVAWVNPQGDWCLQRVTETEITVNGVKGKELVCYWYGLNIENCKPQPRCREQPFGPISGFLPCRAIA